MINIYIAAPWENKKEAREARDILVENGFNITSRWIDLHGDVDKLDPAMEGYLNEQAMNDLEDVFNSDILVLLNISKSEGKAVETGLAVAWQKPVILVGQRTNIFHYLPDFPRVETIQEAITKIRTWEAAYKANAEAMQAQIAMAGLQGSMIQE